MCVAVVSAMVLLRGAERQASMAMRAVMMVAVGKRAVPMRERAVHPTILPCFQVSKTRGTARRPPTTLNNP